jgi:hypothetical protein
MIFESFESFFKKKKKQVEKGIDDAGDVLRPEQHDNELEKIDEDFTAEKENLGNVKKQSFEKKEPLATETEQEYSKRSSDSEGGVPGPTVDEITLNVNSELLRKAQSKGIDLSSALEQQLKRMVSDVR